MSHRTISRMFVVAAASCLVAADAGSGWAIESGLDAGAAVPALKVLVLADDDSYSESDVTAERDKKVSVYAFVQATEWTRPMARFVRGMDKLVSNAGNNARMTAVWLTDDQDQSRKYLPRGRNAMKLQATQFGVYDGDTDGPDGWNINSKAFITVVVCRGAKVTKSIAYVSVNETDVPTVAEILNPKKDN
jgi:hypothetical protein